MTLSQLTPFTSRWHQAYCRVTSLDPVAWPEERCRRLDRYSFLSAFTLRTDEEEAEVHQFQEDFGVEVEWPVLPRTFHSLFPKD